jgi:hypothetical protein
LQSGAGKEDANQEVYIQTSLRYSAGNKTGQSYYTEFEPVQTYSTQQEVTDAKAGAPSSSLETNGELQQ